MKLTLLKAALEHYVISADCSATDKQQAFDAIAECNELAERYAYRKLWKDTIYLLSADSLSDLLNLATYDCYGKLAKTHSNDVPFERFAHAVRRMLVSDMTNRSLEFGFDIVRDLWTDNEADGAHNPDGTFKR